MGTFQNKLKKLVKEHGINGDQQSFFGKRYSNSGEGYLFEFHDEENAQALYENLMEIGVEEALKFYTLMHKESIAESETDSSSNETQHSTLNTQNSENENEGPNSAEADLAADNSQPATKNKGGAVATVPGNSQTTAAPSFHLKEVYDAERGEIVARTPEQQSAAHSLYSLMKMADLAQAILLKKFFDGEHHLDMGYSTKDEFCTAELGESRRNINRKLKVAERLEGLIPISDGTPVSRSLLSENQSEHLEALNGIGLSKLYEVAKVEDANFEEVLTTGVVHFADGREMSLEDIRHRTRNELSRELKGEIDGYKNRNANLLDKKSELEAELKEAQKEINELKQKQETAERLDLMHGTKAATLEGQERLIEYAHEAVRLANKYLTRISLPEDAPKDLQMEVVTLHRTVDGGRQVLLNNNMDAFAGIEETRPTALGASDNFDEETGEILN